MLMSSDSWQYNVREIAQDLEREPCICSKDRRYLAVKEHIRIGLTSAIKEGACSYWEMVSVVRYVFGMFSV